MKLLRADVVVWSVLGVAPLVALLTAYVMPKMPDNHVTCHRNDPDIDECLKTTLNNLLPYFAPPGIPEFSLPSFAPMFVPNMTFDYEQYALKSHILLTNVTVLGMETIQVRSVRSHFDNRTNFQMEITAYMKTFINKGDYEAKAHFLYQPINEKGNYNLTIGDMFGTWRLYGRPMVKEDGKTYTQLDSMVFRPRLGSLKFYASNLFSENKELSDLILIAINQFWQVFYEATVRDFSKTWGAIATDYANRVFHSVPYEDLFPYRKKTSRNTLVHV